MNKWFDHSLGEDRKFSGAIESFQIEFGNIGDTFQIWVKNNANQKDEISLTVNGVFECVNGIHRIKKVKAWSYYEHTLIEMTLV